MKHIVWVILAIIVLSGCVKTADLEKKKADDALLLEEKENEVTSENESSSEELPIETEEDADSGEDSEAIIKEETENLTLSIDELTQQLNESEEKVSELETKLLAAEESSVALSGPTLGNPLLLEATNVMLALSTNDMSTLSLYVPTLSGLRLSPYPFVNLATDVVLTQSDVANLMTLPTIYLWGSYDGSGDPINLTAANYYTEFIYDYNYLIAPQIGQNVILSGGNILNNIATSYPTASYVEFYFPGFDPQYGGLDWSSLTLVFENQGGYWMLVGIVHGQWTI